MKFYFVSNNMIFDFDGLSNNTYIYDNNRKLICKLNGNASFFSAYCIDKKNNLIVTQNDRDDPLILWDMVTGNVKKWFMAYDLTLCFAFTLDGKYTLSGNDSGHIKIWDNNSGELVRNIYDGESIISFLEFTPNGKYLLCGGINGVRLYDSVTYELVRKFDINENRIYTLYVSPCSRYFASSAWEFLVRVWDIESGECIQELGDLNQFIGLKFSGNNYIATKHFNDIIKVWKIGKKDYVLSYSDKKYNRYTNFDWTIKKIKLEKSYKKVLYEVLDKLPKEIIENIVSYVREKECLTVNGKIVFFDA